MALISLFRKTVRSKGNSIPPNSAVCSLLPKEPFPYYCWKGKWLSWCLLSYQSASWPPGSLSTHGSSNRALPWTSLASHSLIILHFGYALSWSSLSSLPLPVPLPHSPDLLTCTLSTRLPHPMAWSNLLSMFSVWLLLPALGSLRVLWL